MEKYITPEMDLIEIKFEDTIMASSGNGKLDENELPDIGLG